MANIESKTRKMRRQLEKGEKRRRKETQRAAKRQRQGDDDPGSSREMDRR